MHEDSTRARPLRHRNAALPLDLRWRPSCSRSPLQKPPNSAHPVAIEVVKPGREGLELTARLTEDGGVIERNINWTVRTIDGRQVYASQSGSVDISVPPATTWSMPPMAPPACPNG